eukprot:4853256-Pyramimonas_sp.AAC.1
MGDPFMVAAWVRAFQPSVARWCSAMAAEGAMEGQMVATGPCDPDPIDLALCQYADDLELSHLGKPNERAASLLARVRRASDLLSVALAEDNCAQNTKKQMSLISLLGPGAHLDLRDIRLGRLQVPGE